MAEKKRYSDEELEEFRAIINEKLKLAYNDYNQMMKQLMNADGNDVDDTSKQGRTGAVGLQAAEVHPGP